MTNKCFFDLKEIEAATRKMYSELPPADDGDTVALLQSSMVEPHAACEVWFLDQLNKNSIPEAVLLAFSCFVGDRITDYARQFDDPRAVAWAQSLMVSKICSHIDMINQLEAEHPDGAAAIGRAIVNSNHGGTA